MNGNGTELVVGLGGEFIHASIWGWLPIDGLLWGRLPWGWGRGSFNRFLAAAWNKQLNG